MGLPREVVAGRSYMITRRVSERRFFLRPDDEVTQAFLYCLGLAAQRTGVVLLFTCACSNHHHTGIFDPEGRYPEFLERFHGLLARCLNALRGRWEAMWASEPTSVVQLVEPEDAFAKMMYALTNPVKDGLVERAHQWPGASSLRRTRPFVVARPVRFFSETGTAPEEVTLHFARPPGFEALTEEAWVAKVDAGVGTIEAAAAAERATTGRRVMGRAAVLRQSWRARPASAEPRRGLSPRIAAASKWARIAALQRSKAFLDAYRRARDAFMRGVDLVAFPPGTYWRLKPAFLPRAWFTAA